MPFLSKLKHQQKWTRSAKATKFFSRFGPQHKQARTTNGIEDLVVIDFKILKGDWPEVEMFTRLTWPGIKISRVVKKKLTN